MSSENTAYRSCRHASRRQQVPASSGPAVQALLGFAVLTVFALSGRATAQVPASSAPARPDRATKANWILAERFSTTSLRNVVGSTALQPRWLGKTDSMWYNWRDRNGSKFYLVTPATNGKRPLFDHVKLAAALSSVGKKPYDATNLPFTTLNFTKDHKKFRFTADSMRYEWNLAAETLARLGRASRDTVATDEERDEQGGGRGGGGGGGGGQFGGGQNQDFRNFAPDSTVFVFARNHNLYIVERAKGDTVQISTDGVKDHSFGFRDTSVVQDDQQDEQGQQVVVNRSRDPRVRPNVVWSPDSKAFAIVRQDSRKVKELYLVNVLAEPRPTLSSYRYSMPGEANVPQQELFVYKRGAAGVTQLDTKKWRDQRMMNIHWPTGSDKLRLTRRDRTQRNLDLVELDVATNQAKVLLSESIENAALEPQMPRYTKRGGDMIWWSERSGWGHYYLYGSDGTFKRALTEGPWRAEQIVDVDTLRGVVYVAGVGREPGEDVYFRHLYRVNADGTGFALVDPGNASHTSVLSPSKKYVVDLYSRVDAAPKAVVRDATGKLVMNLEETDISRLRELGWRPPQSFIVKAADGVTDIYGNMWKPFDFDSTRQYPIVAYVYPGPQTEAVNHTFQAGGVPQQLAQLGFVVIQIGNRGGSPSRSLAYHRYGYYNLRDYALADKKAGIEQLAAKHPWIDIERVGIFGHSGGGFLTAAALLQPPYNDFFKVGVSSSGNHDNNIYNQNWSESNHGLKVIAKGKDDDLRVATAGGPRGARRNGSGNGNGNGRANDGEATAAAPAGFVDDSLRYDIHVPTNIELAPNLKGNLLLVTGDMDNNVHPGNTIRLVNALIKANKRFDFMILPGKPHAYGDMQPYFNRQMMEYFAEHLIGDYYRGGAEIK